MHTLRDCGTLVHGENFAAQRLRDGLVPTARVFSMLFRTLLHESDSLADGSVTSGVARTYALRLVHDYAKMRGASAPWRIRSRFTCSGHSSYAGNGVHTKALVNLFCSVDHTPFEGNHSITSDDGLNTGGLQYNKHAGLLGLTLACMFILSAG